MFRWSKRIYDQSDAGFSGSCGTERSAELKTDAETTICSRIILNNYLKNGQLALAGEESVNGNPAHKLKATVDGGLVLDMFIDKSSYLLVKTSTTISAEGQISGY